MKLSCVIFICPLVIALAIVQLSRTSGIKDHCEQDEWFITNIILKWEDETKIITFDTTNNKGNCPIYTAQIKIDGCTNRVDCKGQPETALLPNNVRENVKQSQLESDCKASAAKVASRAAELEEKEEWLTNNKQKPSTEPVLCIDIKNLDEAE